MSIALNTIPANLRTPGQFVEFDSSRATRGVATVTNKILVPGQKLATGTAATGVPIQVRTKDEAIVYFGRGSILARMIEKLRLNDELSEVWAFPMVDVGAGTAATKTITITGPATASGTIALMIAGQSVPVAVANAATATAIATSIVAAVTAAPDLPVTAASAAGVVTLTAKHKGEAGSSIDVRDSYYQDEALPAGVTIAYAAGVAGATNPDVTAAFTAIGDTAFTAIIMPYTDAANLAATEAALSTRWGPMKALDGIAWTAAQGSYATLAALGPTRNSQFVSMLGFKNPPNPPWEVAAAYGAVCSYALSIDPARPLQTLPLLGILPPVMADRFVQSERDVLLRDGISTAIVDGGGLVLERPITMYQTNSLGIADVAFLDVNTPATLSALRYSLRARIAAKYPRHKLVDDGQVVPAGQPILQPKGIRTEIIAWAMDANEAGLVENLEAFKAGLVVERDTTDRNRVNALVPPDLVNGLRVFAAQIQFIL